MKVLKVIGIIILVILVLFFVIAAFLPGQFRIERSVTVERSAVCLFNQVNDLHNWENWTPFDDDDPSMITAYAGPKSGIGAKSMWESEKQGSGEMIITESIPFRKIATALDFGEQGTAFAYFLFDEADGVTTVSWIMEAEAGYPVERWIFALMKGMMEDTFYTGLAGLKEVCESSSPKTHELSIVSVSDKYNRKDVENPHLYVLDLNSRWIATILDSAEMQDMEQTMSAGYNELLTYVKEKHSEDYGNPFSLWHEFDEQTFYGVFEMGISIKRQLPDEGRIKVRKFEATKAVVGIHYGAYDQTAYMYNAIEKYIAENNYEVSGGPVEVYVIDPSQEPDPEKWETAIMFPIK